MAIAPTTPTPAGIEDVDVDVVTESWLYWAIVIGIPFLTVAIGYAVYLGIGRVSLPIFGLFPGLFLSLTGLVYILASFRNITAQEIGGIFIFDKPTIEVSSTWVVVPLGIAKLIKLPILTEEFETPTEPELIYRGDGNPPDGMKPPTRITFAEGDSSSIDPLERRLTAEVPQVYRFRINDGGFFTFWRRVGGLKEAKRQLEDIGVSLISEELPKVPATEALTHLADYSNQLLDRTRIATRSWGISMVTARLKQIIFSHDLNKAIQAIPEATAKKTTKITDAEGDRQAEILRGEGRGGAAKAEAIGRGEGLRAQAEALGVKGADVLSADVAREIARGPNTKVVLGATGGKELLGMAAAMAEVYKSDPPAAPASSPAGVP